MQRSHDPILGESFIFIYLAFRLGGDLPKRNQYHDWSRFASTAHHAQWSIVHCKYAFCLISHLSSSTTRTSMSSLQEGKRTRTSRLLLLITTTLRLLEVSRTLILCSVTLSPLWSWTLKVSSLETKSLSWLKKGWSFKTKCLLPPKQASRDKDRPIREEMFLLLRTWSIQFPRSNIFRPFLKTRKWRLLSKTWLPWHFLRNSPQKCWLWTPSHTLLPFRWFL